MVAPKECLRTSENEFAFTLLNAICSSHSTNGSLSEAIVFMRTFSKTTTLFSLLLIGLCIVAPSRMAAQTFTVLHTFTTPDPNTGTNSDGDNPRTGLILFENTLYGTAHQGGDSANGTVFKVNVDGTGFATLHSFTKLQGPPLEVGTNFDGIWPRGKLVLSGRTLYGTTSLGGPLRWGTIFAVNIEAAGFTNLHTFASQPNDGSFCYAGMVLSGNTFYGATYSGGGANEGALFAINQDGTDFRNIYSFGNLFGSDITGGFQPETDLALSATALYGTASFGGQVDGSGFGTVFTVQTDGTGFKSLYTFLGGTNGDTPEGGLVVMGNTLYGTTADDEESIDSNYGRIFAINTNGTGFTLLHRFTGDDGRGPAGALILLGNTLYGTTQYGGPSNYGVLFSIKTDGTDFSILHTFSFADGAFPNGSLVFSNNTLYGTTSETVFSLSLGPAAPPQLNMAAIGPSLRFTWPTNATSFTLQSTTNLGPSAFWTAATTQPVLINGLNTVTNSISGAQQFYRLAQ